MNNTDKLPSGRVLVTGATGGIGIALVRRFASAGHDLVLVARDAERLEAFSNEIVQEYGIKAATIPLDLMQAGGAEELVGSGVTICALCPGVTATPMMESIKGSNPGYVKLFAPKISDPDEVADAGYDACMRGQVIRVPGSANQLMALAVATMPKWTARRLVGFLARRTT